MNRNVQNKKINPKTTKSRHGAVRSKTKEKIIYFGKNLKNGLTARLFGCILH